MRNIVKQIILGCGALFFALSCQNRSSEKSAATKTETEATSQPLETQLLALNDSLQTNWQLMSESDERKMASIKRLLDEISYTPRYNALRQRQLFNMHNRVAGLKFDIASMNNSEKIDQYDFAQDSLVSGAINLAAETPGAESYPLIGELTSDIQAEHNKTIIFRIRHDDFARAINKMLDKHGNQIGKLSEPAASVRKVPLFSLTGS